MGKKGEKSTRDLSLDLVASDIKVARVFAWVARRAYSRGKLEQGEFARLAAIKFYCGALQSVLQMTEPERQLFSSDLQTLRTSIQWLSLQASRSHNPSATTHEEVRMEILFKLLQEKG